MVPLIVVVQERRYQIDIGQSAPEYPRNAATPANRTTEANGAPAGRARPATYAANTPITRANTNHCARLPPIAGGPLGMTVSIATGPLFIFSMNSGERMPWVLAGRGIM